MFFKNKENKQKQLNKNKMKHQETVEVNTLAFEGLKRRFNLEEVGRTFSRIDFKIKEQEYSFLANTFRVKRANEKSTRSLTIGYFETELVRLGVSFSKERTTFGLFHNGRYNYWQVEDVIRQDREYVLWQIASVPAFKLRIESIAKSKTFDKEDIAIAQCLLNDAKAMSSKLEKEKLERESQKKEGKVFWFGKYKGQEIEKVYEIDPKYIEWCKKNISDFKVQ